MGHGVNPDIQHPVTSSAQPPSLSLWLQQGEHVALALGPFHVSDDGAAHVLHEFYAHLRALSLQTGPAQHFGDPGKLDGLHTARVHDGVAAAVRGRAWIHSFMEKDEQYLCSV